MGQPHARKFQRKCLVAKNVLESLSARQEVALAMIPRTRITTRLAPKAMSFENLLLRRTTVVRGVLEAPIVRPRAAIATMQRKRIIMHPAIDSAALMADLVHHRLGAKVVESLLYVFLTC